jgi:acetylornithine deacetylase
MDKETEARIMKEIDDSFEEHVGLLQRIIRIPSVNPWFKDEPSNYGEQAVQEEFEKIFVDMGADAIDMWEPSAKDLEHRKDGPGFYPGRDFTGRPNLVAKFKGSDETKPVLMIQGHCDVVSVGSKWTKDPFGAERIDGKIYGRGTIDMKGGMAAAIAGFQILQKLEIPMEADLLFASVADEEAGGMGTLSLVDRGYIAKAGTIVPESTNLNIAPLCRGILWGEVILHGRAGHIELERMSWQDGGAVDAIDYGKKLLNAIEKKNLEWADSDIKNHKYLPIPCQIRVAQLDAGEFPTTYASSCKITFNAQYLPIQKDSNGLGSNVKQELEEFFSSFITGDDWFDNNPPTVNWLVDADCGETPDTDPIVTTTLAAAKAVGLKSVLEGCMSHTDMGLMIDSGSPTINFGPGHMGIAHQADEHIEEEDFKNAIKVFALTIAELCNPKAA